MRDLAEDRQSNPATAPEEAGSFAVAGGPAYSNNLTIDGLDNNDDRAASERFQPSMEAVEEVQVITNQFSAEYGRASGGRINIKTRGGAQQLRGRAFFFFTDEALMRNIQKQFTWPQAASLRAQSRLYSQWPVDSSRYETRRPFSYSLRTTKVLDSALIDTLVPVQQNPRSCTCAERPQGQTT